MKKVMRLTEEEINDFNNPNMRISVMENVLGIKVRGRSVTVGDTMIKVKDASKLDVYRDQFAMKEVYYIIMNVVDEDLAWAISIY